MTLIQEPPVKELPVRTLEVPVAVSPEAPTKKVWPTVVRWTAAGVAGLGVVVALGLGAANYNSISSLEDDVSTLQGEVAVMQDQVHAVRMDLIVARSGTSLANEHLAQVPTSIGLEQEHLAQAPTP